MIKEHLLSATKEDGSVDDDFILENSLSQGDGHIEEDPNVDYEMLLKGLRACAERASKPRTTSLDRTSKTSKELLERRRDLRLVLNASHTERQKKILEAAQRRASLKKCRRDLHGYNISTGLVRLLVLRWKSSR
ncbi:hypothetical protein RB195_013340 [Necator americanus]|uniref:Uncharacterized protein n=1 Tax=Necator americanus TaxID=51031 RepID=A0ABR1DV05_NECAM